MAVRHVTDSLSNANRLKLESRPVPSIFKYDKNDDSALPVFAVVDAMYWPFSLFLVCGTFADLWFSWRKGEWSDVTFHVGILYFCLIPSLFLNIMWACEWMVMDIRMLIEAWACDTAMEEEFGGHEGTGCLRTESEAYQEVV